MLEVMRKQVDSYLSRKLNDAKVLQLFRPLGENLGKEMPYSIKHLFPINFVVWKQIMLIAFVENIMRSYSIALWNLLARSIGLSQWRFYDFR